MRKSAAGITSFALALFVGQVFYPPEMLLPGTSAAKEQGKQAAAEKREVQAIVRGLEAHYHSALTLRATFLERYREARQDVRVESGTAYFKRSGRMRWEYEEPEKKLFVADGKTVWFYVPADRTVTRVRMKESADWRTPLALLTGKVKLSRLCGRIELVKNRPHTNDWLARRLAAEPGDHVVLRCLPRYETERLASEKSAGALDAIEGNNSFDEVLLEVDLRRAELAGVVVRQAGGIEIEYRFADWQENLPLPDAIFRFQAPRGVAIVDESGTAATSR